MMRIIFACVVLARLTIVHAGDDASVHVHVESAPGPDMGMTLPLFNYYRSAMGAPPNPGLAAAFSKWHGDEVHSQGPDQVQPPTPVAQAPNGGSLQHANRPLRIAPEPFSEYRSMGATSPHRHGPQRAGQQQQMMANSGEQRTEGSRTIADFVVPFPGSRKSHDQPRHVHGGVDTIPPWLLRKRMLNRYGLKKYLQPYSQVNLERMEQYDPEAEPTYPRSARIVTKNYRLASPGPADYDDFERTDY